MLVLASSLLAPLAAAEEPPEGPKTVRVGSYTLAERYVGLRQMALERAGEGPEKAKPGEVRIVLMDMEVGGDIATQMCADDGSVSLYLSLGGGMIGLGDREPIREACAALIVEATEAAARMERVTEPTFPGKDRVQLLVVTDVGVFTAEVSGVKPDPPRKLASLFARSQQLMTTIRLTMSSEER